MNPITRIYYTDPWRQELTTTVLSCNPAADNYEVTLAETIFYPTGGGQPHDLGSINGLPLLDVFEREGKVYHILPSPLEHGPVKCVLDWDRRLDHMQQHTGQHLLSAVLLSEYGYKTESFHLGEEHSSIDLSTPRLPASEQAKAERIVNDIILANLEIRVYSANPEEIQQLPIRKLPALEGDLRIVEIEGYDYSPCSGTHLSSTGQLALCKLLRTENYKGMTRLYFAYGTRALKDYSLKHKICSELSTLLSVPIPELPQRTEQELDTRRELERVIAELKAEVMDLRAQAIVSHGADYPLVAKLPHGNLEDAKLLAKSILELGTFSVIIELQNHLVIAHNLPTSLHCGQLITEHALPLGGRGGGSAFSAQVFFAQQEAKEKLRGLLLDKLK